MVDACTSVSDLSKAFSTNDGVQEQENNCVQDLDSPVAQNNVNNSTDSCGYMSITQKKNKAHSLLKEVTYNSHINRIAERGLNTMVEEKKLSCFDEIHLTQNNINKTSTYIANLDSNSLVEHSPIDAEADKTRDRDASCCDNEQNSGSVASVGNNAEVDANEPFEEEREVTNTKESSNLSKSVKDIAENITRETEINLERNTINKDSVNTMSNSTQQSKLDVSKSKLETAENFNKPGTSKVPKKLHRNKLIDTDLSCVVRRSERVRKPAKSTSREVIYTTSVHLAKMFNKGVTCASMKRRTTRTKKISKNSQVPSDNTLSTTITSRFDNATNVNNAEEDYNHNEQVPNLHESPPKKQRRITNKSNNGVKRATTKRSTNPAKKDSKNCQVISDNTFSTTITSRFDNATNVNNAEEDCNHNEEVANLHESPSKKQRRIENVFNKGAKRASTNPAREELKNSQVVNDNTLSTTITSRFDNATIINNANEDYNHNADVQSVHESPTKRRHSTRLSSVSKTCEITQNRSKCVSFIDTSPDVSKTNKKSQPIMTPLDLNDTVRRTRHSLRQSHRTRSNTMEVHSKPPKLVAVKENSDLAICYTQNHAGDVKSGFLEIKGGGRKLPYCTKTQNILYTVSEGEALFCIDYKHRVTLVKGCDYLVGKGCTYSIENVSKRRRLLLHFIKFSK